MTNVWRWLERRTVRQRVLGYALVLAVVGVGLLWITPEAGAVPARSWHLPVVLIIPAFALAEATALHVEIRKESHSLSLSGIPMMFGLLYLSPIELVTAYVAAAIPTMLWIRKSDLLKTTWNSCLFFTQGALGAFIVRSTIGSSFPDGFDQWLWVLVAILVPELISLLAVPIVIMAVDTTFRPNLFADVGQSQILAALGGTFTVTAASAAADNPLMLLFAVIPLVGVGALLRSHGHLGQNYRDLQQLHEFTRALANERGGRALDIGLAELVKLLRARTAGLLTFPHGEEEEPATLRLLDDDRFLSPNPAPIELAMRHLVDDDEEPVRRLSSEHCSAAGRIVLDHFDATELLVASLRGDGGRDAVLFVVDRLGMTDHFSDDEVGLFSSLGQTLRARLVNDHLVAQLEEQALHDPLTGLANRLTFEVALTAQLSDPNKRGVVAILDLDRFKDINDSLGHDTGDELLIEVARRLERSVRSTDLVARLGGDEFALFLAQPANAQPSDFGLRIEHLYRQLTAPVRLKNIAFDIGSSLGVATWPADGTDSEALLRHADAAMYHAKRNRLGVVSYEPDLDDDAPRRLQLSMSLRRAIDDGEIDIHVQPKVRASDGGLSGGEALARWTSGEHGVVSPSEFIPLVSQLGLTGKLTRLVTSQAADVMAELRAVGHTVSIAVNLTPHDLLDPDLPRDLADIVERAGVPCEQLVVEITEDAMVVDFETSVSVLGLLRASGIKVAIDDFGTGYSSLQHLHQLPVDQLKIDGSFVQRMSVDSGADAIVRASVNLANDLGLSTVAEGVEDAEALERATSLGCDEIQGYHVSRPLPVADFVVWASQRAGQDLSPSASP